MSLTQTPRSEPEQLQLQALKRPWQRPLLLLGVLLLSATAEVWLRLIAPQPDAPVVSFIQVWLLSFLPYFLGCSIVLATPQQRGRWQWGELLLILAGALLLRAILLPLPPDLSHDSWRYVWDARITLHGYSPYVYAPGDPRLLTLRDFIYDNSRFRDVPTIYPPGAQAIYLLSYVLAPSNLFFLKGIFLVFDLVTCRMVALLLKRQGLDPSRCIVYAWCPLPIVEFAIQGHVDALTVCFTVLTVACAYGRWRGARALTGFFLAMATLTKLYPIIFLLAIARRRDWALLFTCAATIIVAYIPYFILGNGQVLGFLSTYTGEASYNSGIILIYIGHIVQVLRLRGLFARVPIYLVDLIAVGGVALWILRLRRAGGIKIEAAVLLLTGVVFAASSHIFPWYTTALLVWVPLLIGPLWIRGQGLNALGLAAALVWYFACISITGYFYLTPDWTLYYLSAYTVVVVGLGIALFAHRGWLKRKKGTRRRARAERTG